MVVRARDLERYVVRVNTVRLTGADQAVTDVAADEAIALVDRMSFPWPPSFLWVLAVGDLLSEHPEP